MFPYIPISFLAKLYGFGAALSLFLVLYTSDAPVKALGCLSIAWLFAIGAIVLSIQDEKNETENKVNSL